MTTKDISFWWVKNRVKWQHDDEILKPARFKLGKLILSD